MPRQKQRCAMCLFIEAATLEKNKRSQKRFWQNRQKLIKERINKMKSISSLNACSLEHKEALNAMRLIKIKVESNRLEVQLNKLSNAIQLLGFRQKKYDDLVTNLGKSHPETLAAKAELIHQKNVVGQRKRRAVELNPQPVVSKPLTEAFTEKQLRFFEKYS